MIRFLLSMFAFWGFNTLGWIVLNEGVTGFWGYFWLVFWVGLIVALVGLKTPQYRLLQLQQQITNPQSAKCV